MKKIKKFAAVMLSLSMLCTMFSFTSQAASKVQIKSVSIEIDATIIPEQDYGDENIDVDVKTQHCSFSNYEILNEEDWWKEDSVPKLKIYLSADDGYYFYISKASSIKLKGATYVSAAREDSSTTLILTVTLPTLAEYVYDVENVTLGYDGVATWTPAIGAGSYEVRLLRNGNTIGGTQTVTTNSYNCAAYMTKEAAYSVKVKPVNGVNEANKGAWATSAALGVSAEMAENFKAIAAEQSGEWIQDEVGWWYKNHDGSYTTNNWQQIDGYWYYFNEVGYMVTGWIESGGKQYYCGESGAMLANTTTPDGSNVGIDGAKY